MPGFLSLVLKNFPLRPLRYQPPAKPKGSAQTWRRDPQCTSSPGRTGGRWYAKAINGRVRSTKPRQRQRKRDGTLPAGKRQSLSSTPRTGEYGSIVTTEKD